MSNPRVSFGKIWAICQMGRWRSFRRSNSRPFLKNPSDPEKYLPEVSFPKILPLEYTKAFAGYFNTPYSSDVQTKLHIAN